MWSCVWCTVNEKRWTEKYLESVVSKLSWPRYTKIQKKFSRHTRGKMNTFLLRKLRFAPFFLFWLWRQSHTISVNSVKFSLHSKTGLFWNFSKFLALLGDTLENRDTQFEHHWFRLNTTEFDSFESANFLYLSNSSNNIGMRRDLWDIVWSRFVILQD